MTEQAPERRGFRRRIAEFTATKRNDVNLYRLGIGIGPDIFPVPGDSPVGKTMIEWGFPPDATMTLEKPFLRRSRIVEAYDAEGNELPADAKSIKEYMQGREVRGPISTILFNEGEPIAEITFLHGEWPSRFNTPEDPSC